MSAIDYPTLKEISQDELITTLWEHLKDEPDEDSDSSKNTDDSAISQVRKVLEALHINQRVVATTVEFPPNQGQPPISIDGIDYLKEIGTDMQGEVEQIKVSRVFNHPEEEAHD